MLRAFYRSGESGHCRQPPPLPCNSAASRPRSRHPEPTPRDEGDGLLCGGAEDCARPAIRAADSGRKPQVVSRKPEASARDGAPL
jgi:hypothetical protein